MTEHDDTTGRIDEETQALQEIAEQVERERESGKAPLAIPDDEQEAAESEEAGDSGDAREEPIVPIVPPARPGTST